MHSDAGTVRYQSTPWQWGWLHQVWTLQGVCIPVNPVDYLPYNLLTRHSWKANLGPVAPVIADPQPNPEPYTGLGYNPRCLRRDISSAAATGWTKDSDVVSLIKSNTNFLNFTTRMQGDFANGFLGVHTAGHFTIGGDPGGDLFASPGDPAFYFHHAMIDRVYWTWQNLDLKNRLNAIGATITVNNEPPSRNATLADRIGMGYVGVPEISIKEATNTMAGPFCYIYA